MYGFRGNAAEAYLTAVDEALLEAVTAHEKDPFRAGSSIVVPLPPLPFRRNECNPHPPDTAHSGGHSTGVGNDSNIVVGNSEYNAISGDIRRTTDGMGYGLSSIVAEIESLCETSFIIPLTTRETLIIALGLRHSLGEFRSFSDDITSEIQKFATAIVEVS
jgi:hypothetical protein